MVSGTYSTIYIASAFVEWWQRQADKKTKKGQKHADMAQPPKPVASEQP